MLFGILFAFVRSFVGAAARMGWTLVECVVADEDLVGLHFKKR
jgi:hypothetical protein